MRSLLIYLFLITSISTCSQGKLKLFIDCKNAAVCDFNYIRQQIPVADFVRDRLQSDVHILITRQSAGNGGDLYSMILIAQKPMQENNDTLQFITEANATPDDVRQKIVKAISSSIVPYLLRSGQMDMVNISFENTTDSFAAVTDKWNYWNFRIGGNAYFSGDNNYRQRSFSANAYAGRITDASKTEFFLYKSSERNRYTIMDSNEFYYLSTVNDYMEFEQSYVKTISPKWSWAIQGEFRKSTYNNIRNESAIAAGIEYNIFPYKASNTKFLAFRYMMEATQRNYIEETIYGKKKQTLFSNDLGLYASVTQPWGNISSSIEWYNYLHDLSKNNLSINANIQLQLFKGISFNFYVYGSIINDQLSVAKEGATQEEVLLRLRALSASYNYYTGIGINYRFGTSLNNYVNPRFTNGRN